MNDHFTLAIDFVDGKPQTFDVSEVNSIGSGKNHFQSIL